MKPSTYRRIEARNGFHIDKVSPKDSPDCWKKFTLTATYPDERQLMVYVWRRTDVHIAIERAIKLQLTCAAHRLRHLIANLQGGKLLDEQCDSSRAWSAYYLRNGEAVLEALKGKLVRAPHPITTLNPQEWMTPAFARADSDGRIWVRSENTSWFPLDRCEIKDTDKAGAQ